MAARALNAKERFLRQDSGICTRCGNPVARVIENE